MPAKLVEAFDNVNVWLPSSTWPAASPESVAMLAPLVLPEISNSPPAETVTTLDAALLDKQRALPNYTLRTRRPELFSELLREQVTC